MNFLDVVGDMPSTFTAADGLVLSNIRVSKSSGFDTTQYILDAVMTVASTASSGVLVTWLNDRLKAGRDVVATLDGDEVNVQPDVDEQ